MNNEPAQAESQISQSTVSAPQQPQATTPKRSLKMPFLAFLAIILLAGTSYSVYIWQHKKVNNSNAEVARLNSQVASLKAGIPKLNTKSSQSVAAPTPIVETDTLPNGTKVSYPLNQVNANVVWWSDGNDAPSSSNIPANGYMTVSDKHVIQFLSTLPTDVIQGLCGSDYNTEIGFQMGIYDTAKKSLSLHNQYENCIDAAASSKGGKYEAQAQQVLTSATNDLQAWANSLTVTN